MTETKTEQDLPPEVVELYEAGFNVLPAHLGAKSPALSTWAEYRTRRVTRRELHDWFGHGERNLWVMTGQASGLVVLDCDSPAAIDFWKERLPEIESTATVDTAKGRHYWFRLEPGQTAKSWSRHEGDLQFDVRAEGTGVIAPPSRHPSGVAYAWRTPLGSLRRLPAPLLNPEPERGAGGPSGLAALLQALPQHEGEGRNQALTRIAGHLAKTVGFEDGFTALLLAINNSLAEPLPEAEVTKLAASIWATEQRAKQETFDREVARRVPAEVATLKVRALARLAFAQGEFEAPPVLSGGLFLLTEYPRARWAVSELLPAGGNALLAAPFKAGKTTFVLNLLRSFCDNRPFLGRFPVRLGEGKRVAYFNYEMAPATLQRWLRELEIREPDRFCLVNARGRGLYLQDRNAQDWAVEWLQERQVETMIIDPFALAFAGDENSNSEVRDYTVALDRVKERAGVSNLVLAAHFGRADYEVGKEHARGATRLDDWADARWVMTQQGEDRFLVATGRDVDVEEGLLVYHHKIRSFVYRSGGRDAHRLSTVQGAILRHLVQACQTLSGEDLERALSSRGIRQRVPGRSPIVDRALADLIDREVVRVRFGSHGRKQHFPGEYLPEGGEGGSLPL